MRHLIATSSLIVLLSACATNPATSDPEGFRDASQQKVERTIDLPVATAANSLNKGAIKCWESGDIRVSFTHEQDGYTLFISTYIGSTRNILFLADVTPIGTSTSKIVVKHTFPHASHRRFAENLIDWAEGKATKCDSLVVRE